MLAVGKFFQVRKPDSNVRISKTNQNGIMLGTDDLKNIFKNWYRIWWENDFRQFQVNHFSHGTDILRQGVILKILISHGENLTSPGL